ncbi:MAG: hypothetical protein ACTSRI_18405 [Promethearchaeota archaeon]
MIVIFVNNIDDFFLFLEKRIMNEIFYEYKEIKNQINLSSEVKIEIILHFLAKIEEYIILFETKIDFTKKSNSNLDEDIITELQKIFNKVDSSLSLVKGKIREIFISFTS